MPHCKNTQTIREIAKCFEKNTEKAMNDIANTIKALNSIIASISGAKYSRTFKCWHTERVVKFDGMEVKLIFCRTSKKAPWKALLTTDLAIKFDKAYKTYATRWTIEVFHKEAKKYLNLGKC